MFVYCLWQCFPWSHSKLHVYMSSSFHPSPRHCCCHQPVILTREIMEVGAVAARCLKAPFVAVKVTGSPPQRKNSRETIKTFYLFALSPSSLFHRAACLQHLPNIYLLDVMSFLSTDLWSSLCILLQLQGSYPLKKEKGDCSSCTV